MLDQDTKRRIDTARQILVGKVPIPQAQVEQITTALIYKFMDDMDRENEELGGKAKFLIGKLKQYTWGRLLSKELSGQERMLLYIDALNDFSKAEQIPELFRTIFKGTFLPYRDAETLNLFLKEINGFTYDHSEELGNSFEYLLSILGAQGQAGQFRTPRHIIDFIVEVVDPRKDDKILDPACGTAGFLISAYKHIKHRNSSNFKVAEYVPSFSKKAVNDVALIEIQSNGDYRGDKLTPDARKKLAKNIIGYDISSDMVRLSLVNMYLHGFNTPQIFEYDTLTYEDRWGDNFDIILANPPFMSPKGGIRPHKSFRISANRSEVLFVDYIAEHLTLKGRAGVIVPEGIIFQSANAYKDLRKMLIEDNYLWAVVSLPAGVFKPYSGVKTSILFFDRVRVKQNDEILFVKVSNDGFDLGDQRRAIDGNELPEAYRVLQDWQKGDKIESSIAHLVKKQVILKSGDCSLMADRYKQSRASGITDWDMISLDELLDYEQPTKYIVKSEKYSDGYRTPVLTAGKTFILGYTNENEGIFRDRLPVIIFDDFTTATKLVDFPFKVKSSAMKILHAREDRADVKYVYYVIQGIDFPRNEHKRYWISQYSKIKIPLPPLEVQKEIVAELDGYQRVIDGALQIVENWKPSIKINPEWAKLKLGKISENLDGKRVPIEKSRRKSGEYPYYGASGIVDYVEEFLFDEDLLLVSEDGANLTMRSTPIAFSVSGKVWVNNHAHVLRFDHRETQVFVELYLNSIPLDNYITGSAQPKLIQKNLSEIQIPFPPLDEQKSIVANNMAEKEAVESAKKLIEIHEQKIKNRIAEVWGMTS